MVYSTGLGVSKPTMMLIHLLILHASYLLSGSLGQESQNSNTIKQPQEMTVKMKEYCHLEVFNATCPKGSVLLMQYARYGRMKLGRCLTTSYYIGCYADILHFADSRCSGRQNCVINILDPELVTFQPCRKDLMAYLEASYTCVPVQSRHISQCPQEGHYEISVGAGYLSIGQGEPVVGSSGCPWFIKVQPGQRIVWTLYDFNDLGYKNQLSSNSPKCPYSFKFLEGDAEVDVPVCVGRQRESDVYTTRRHYVKVYMLRQTALNNPTKFLLNFRAVGCPDFQPVPDAWIRRSESTAVVVCNNTRETWHFVCRDNFWVGELRNCTHQPKADVITANGGLRYSLHYGILLAVALGLVLGVFFGAVLLVCMFVHRVRRRHRKRARRTEHDLLQGESMEDKDAVSIPLRHGDHFDTTTGYLSEDAANLCGHTIHYQFPTGDDGQSGGGNVEDGPDIIYTTSRMANVRCGSNCVACQGPQVLGVRTLNLGGQSGRSPTCGAGHYGGGGISDNNAAVVSLTAGAPPRGGPHENIYDTRKLVAENIYGTARRHPQADGLLVNGAGTLHKNKVNLPHHRIAETTTVASSQQNPVPQSFKENAYEVGKRLLYSTASGVDNVDKQVVTTL